MATIKVKQGAGDEPHELVQSLVAGQQYPFVAQLTHKNYKPLVVPSTGISDVIAPNKPIEFKVKSFEQAWVVVTDCAALAKRWNREDEDYVTITSPAVAVEGLQPETPATEEAETADTQPKLTKAQQAALKAAEAAASE